MPTAPLSSLPRKFIVRPTSQEIPCVLCNARAQCHHLPLTRVVNHMNPSLAPNWLKVHAHIGFQSGVILSRFTLKFCMNLYILCMPRVLPISSFFI
jgi:hypothetical protein